MKYQTKPNSIKKDLVASISEDINTAKSIVIVDYTGLKVFQATSLRQAVKKAGGKMLVVKNTLFKIASGLKDLELSGLSAFILSQKDEISAIKAVSDFSKKNGVLTLKSGVLGDKVLTAQEVADLAAIPSKEIMISKALGSLKSPLYSLANALNWNISKLVRTLDALRVSKS